MKAILKIEGMVCRHCEAHIKDALAALPEVKSVKVSHTLGTAEVCLKAKTGEDILRSAVEDAGYTLLRVSFEE